ncbi:hypothetical protein QWY93_04040 [Echinicola jeungdonensis]|uniref:Lipoprotein n=1 Tax=Echinicola jeungdonensis TaxID=709343 RepID=A0ABV5J392_9BACT|nr:hypothetical protein [Echinicola jeungdonensis]MDN3668496.1 hypothetical protein [Echinicola jeungdonensis]
MRKKYFIIAILFALVGTGCSDESKGDNEPGGNFGAVSVDDITINLSQGYIEDYGQIGSSYNLDFSARGANSEKAASVVYFELFSSKEDDLATGTYSLGKYEDAQSNTYTKWGEIALGSDLIIDSSKNDYTINEGISIRPTSGTFAVSENGEKYKVSFTGFGTATYYSDGEITNTKSGVSLEMTYEGDVERYAGQELKTKSNTAERSKMRRIFVK